MLIDKRIQELTEKGAKQLLRGALADIAGRMSCETCAMHLVCGKEASEDDCMYQVMVMLAVPKLDETDEDQADVEEQDEEGTTYYDPDTMKIKK